MYRSKVTTREILGTVDGTIDGMEVGTFVRIVDGSKDGFSDGLRLFDGRLLINFVGTLDG